MEPESRKLVGESSTRPTRTRPRSNRTKLVEESPITPRSSKKKNTRKRKATREKFYSLADPGILDQKEEKGRVYYLCNWADDPETGESFPPSWVRDGFSYTNKQMNLPYIGTLRRRYPRRDIKLAEQEVGRKETGTGATGERRPQRTAWDRRLYSRVHPGERRPQQAA